MPAVTVGITTAERSEPYLSRTLESLRNSSWSGGVYIRSEPGVVLPALPDGSSIYINETRQGCFHNWHQAAWHLVEHSNTPWILLLQDDVIFAADVFAQLPAVLQRFDRPDVGFVSLYTNRAMAPTHIQDGWGLANYRSDKGYWGALATCWRRDSLHAALQTPALSQPELAHPPGTASVMHRKIDVLIGRACLHLSLKIYTPLPSLVDHIGERSTIGRDLIPGIQAGRRGVGFTTNKKA